ncbi:hypothetical protein AB6A40_008687 [Gnathostoma spinigerum]|uniref:BMERB domain-containing protein n=1 Tax=Gnathostoma spinigerum TaxID=75299 RepID=A0ABD6EQ41_9BILA
MLNNVEDLREKARLRAKMKSDEELGLIGGRSSTSNVTGDSLRLTRHASLQLTSHRLSPESERIAQAIKNSPVLETPNSWRRGFSVGNEEEKCEITKCVSFRSPKSHSPVKADGGLLSRLFPIDFKVTSRKQNSFNQSESSERSCPQQRSSLVQTKEDSNSSSLDDRLHLRQGSSRQDVHVSSHSHLSELPLSDRMVRRVQKRATQIARHKEQDRIRTAQDIERSLQEAEIRKSEVISVGEDLELRLQEDSENRWILEQWLVYVHELEQIEKLETHLKLRLRELKIIDEYKRLHNCLKLLQEDESVISREGSSMNEKDVLKEILRVIDERDAIRKEIALSNKSSDETPFSALDSLQEKQKKANSYYCYKPVFLKS